jgi:murein L,D-transpeptidase YcbB/YkuD
LKREGWSEEQLDRALQDGKTETVVLKRPIEVYLNYFTCWVDDQGRIQFRRDYYSKDFIEGIGKTK